ncbi:DUF3883 domain-containing protein [Polaribacter uvawellassae]|uniref:DUF3883 domain-containing protein n=1 Tax=Polaribacter uvawellassae TaxID=3133495 RepID=UPI00321C2783
MRDITSQSKIREVLSEFIPKDKWLHITEVYSIFEKNHTDFRPDDNLPLADYNSQEQWKRNIRVALRQYKLKHLIVWNGNEKYLFPENEIVEQKKVLSKNKGLSEKELWEQLEKNRIIGLQGEEYVVNIEKRKLIDLNLKKLADKVKRVSDTNVANGYDIISYQPNGEEKFIEVKTTVTSKFEFDISANELKQAENLSENYYLYFIRNFDNQKSENKILIYSFEDLKNNFELKATSYKAKLRK